MINISNFQTVEDGFDDLEGKAPAWNQVSNPVEEFASISCVGEDHAHPTKVEKGGE